MHGRARSLPLFEGVVEGPDLRIAKNHAKDQASVQASNMIYINYDGATWVFSRGSVHKHLYR